MFVVDKWIDNRHAGRCIFFLNGMLPPCVGCFLGKNILSHGRIIIPFFLYNLHVSKR